MIAMLLSLASISLWGAIATIAAVAVDGYRAVPVDPNLLP